MSRTVFSNNSARAVAAAVFAFSAFASTPSPITPTASSFARTSEPTSRPVINATSCKMPFSSGGKRRTD